MKETAQHYLDLFNIVNKWYPVFELIILCTT